MITKVVNVDLNLPIYERLTAKQGDIASRFILFHLLDGDTPFDLTGKSVRVYARKPDKTEIFNDLVINDKTKGYCTLELTSQCLAEAGIVKMELYISESGKVLTSIPFDLEVIGCINTTNSVVSTNEFSALEAALGSLQDYNNFKREIVEARGSNSSLKAALYNLDLQLNMKADKTDGGLDRLKATSKFITSLPSYIGLVNTAYDGDDATRFYILPKAPVTSGAGGCIKIFADDYPENGDYRDLGIYFHADQNGDKGYYGNGVNWINVKVLDGGQYDGKHPDLGFSFQDGKVVAGRVTCFGNNKPVWVFGSEKPTAHGQGIFYIAEYQDSVAIMNEKIISFLKSDNSVGGSIRCNTVGEVIFSSSTVENHMVDGVKIYDADNNKITFEKTTYHNSNIVISNNSDGLILKSPDGSRFKVMVDNDGTLKTVRM